MPRSLRPRGASRPAPRPSVPPLALALALVLAASPVACGDDDPPSITEVPVYPGATLRGAESAFQRRLLEVVLGPGGGVQAVEVYETPAAFAAVAGFYEPWFEEGSSTTGRFFVASRIRQLAEGARSGLPQPLAAGGLLFGAGRERPGEAGGDTLTPDAVADSLAVLAERLENVEGLITVGRISLATSPPASALVSIERPHLDASRKVVDSLTVFTILTSAEPGPAAGAAGRP